MEVTNTMVPYIVKKYKILSLGETDDNVLVAYVDDLSEDDVTQLTGFLDKNVDFVEKISSDQFWKMASEMYPEVSFTPSPTIEETNEQKPKEKTTKTKRNNRRTKKEDPAKVAEDTQPSDNVSLDLSSISTEDLVNEIRSRQMAVDAEAIIDIRQDRSVGFEFTKLSWPSGRFKTSIRIIGEEPIPESKKQEPDTAKAK